MSPEQLSIIEEALFEMGLFISGVNQHWNLDQRKKYEEAMEIVACLKNPTDEPKPNTKRNPSKSESE